MGFKGAMEYAQKLYKETDDPSLMDVIDACREALKNHLLYMVDRATDVTDKDKTMLKNCILSNDIVFEYENIFRSLCYSSKTMSEYISRYINPEED